MLRADKGYGGDDVRSALLMKGILPALVGRNGSADWLCWPRFDSAACLSALLGTDQNGCWSLAPKAEVGHTGGVIGPIP